MQEWQKETGQTEDIAYQYKTVNKIRLCLELLEVILNIASKTKTTYTSLQTILAPRPICNNTIQSKTM